MQALSCRIQRVEDLGFDNHVLHLEGDFESALPGQFCMLSLKRGWPVLLPRPFSYFDLEPGERATILVKAIGPGTRALAEALPGTELLFTGPLGAGFPEPTGPEPVCIAGGVGLAPFLLWAAHRLSKTGSGIPLLYGGASRDLLVGREQFPKGAQRWFLSTDDGSEGFHGNVLELYKDLLARGDVDPLAPVHCCGPDPMMKAVALFCAEQGRDCFVSLETYMACGYGVCNGCSVEVKSQGRFEGKKYVKTCTEGPVFHAQELHW